MPAARQPKAFTVIGWILSALPLLMLGVASVITYFVSRDQITQGAVHLGFPARLSIVIFSLELGCAVVYAIPSTAVLGAILITGFCGGAIACHVRIGENQFVVALILGIITWLGVYFRDPRLRALIPFRTL